MKNPILFLILLILVFPSACSKKVAEQKTELPAEAVTVPILDDDIPASDPKLGPMDSIKDLDKKVDTYQTGSNLSAETVESNRKLKRQIIRGTFDISELCRVALGGHWNEINTAQQSQFVALMTELLEKKAILSKEQVKGNEKPYQIIYATEKFLDDKKESAFVGTKLTVPSEKVTLNINYKLLKTQKGWKIFDVIVDEASLVENYKFQFDTIIKKSGYQELINRMQKKLTEMD